MHNKRLEEVITILLGIAAIVWKVYDITQGTTFGLIECSKITVAEFPVSYWVSICFIIAFGVFLIWGGLERLISGKHKIAKNPFDVEIK